MCMVRHSRFAFSLFSFSKTEQNAVHKLRISTINMACSYFLSMSWWNYNYQLPRSNLHPEAQQIALILTAWLS